MEASARRIRRARERGDVPRSGELTAAAAFAATALALILGGAFVVGRLGAMVKAGLAAATVAPPDLPGALRGAAGELLALSAPLLGAAALAALVVGLAQTGGLFTLRVGPRFGRPRGGAGAALGRLVLVAAAAAIAVGPALGDLGRLGSAPALAAFLGDVLARFLGWSVFALALVGALDLYRARRRFLERMRATRQEELRERREAEGDPRVRAEMRRRAL
ncbi:MAG TPA: EscU/YscU/HrcU family type III secretion system export apparatus switch protein [Haliangiales bacterium]|nr:EscU/YscU/HrcU family type III secretion system export apparatus switch protein [Haliangiales bacterium]